MKAIVDHRARKQVIIANAIQLFARQGYNDVTFQDLADSSGIAGPAAEGAAGTAARAG